MYGLLVEKCKDLGTCFVDYGYPQVHGKKDLILIQISWSPLHVQGIQYLLKIPRLRKNIRNLNKNSWLVTSDGAKYARLFTLRANFFNLKDNSPTLKLLYTHTTHEKKY